MNFPLFNTLNQIQAVTGIPIRVTGSETWYYIAFHAEGKTDPTASDIKYYRLLKMWHEHDDVGFRFINSHDKVAAVRDTSKKETL